MRIVRECRERRLFRELRGRRKVAEIATKEALRDIAAALLACVLQKPRRQKGDVCFNDESAEFSGYRVHGRFGRLLIGTRNR